MAAPGISGTRAAQPAQGPKRDRTREASLQSIVPIRFHQVTAGPTPRTICSLNSCRDADAEVGAIAAGASQEGCTLTIGNGADRGKDQSKKPRVARPGSFPANSRLFGTTGAAALVSGSTCGMNRRTRSPRSPGRRRCRGRPGSSRWSASGFPERATRLALAQADRLLERVGAEAAARGDVPVDRQRLLPGRHDLDPAPDGRPVGLLADQLHASASGFPGRGSETGRCDTCRR